MKLVQELIGHKDRVWCVKWNKSGSILASCSSDKDIRLWAKEKNDNQFKCKAVLSESHQRTIRSIAWSNDSKQLAACSFDATTSIWDCKAETWECSLNLEGHENEVKSVAWSKDNQYLATCSRDKTVWIWEKMSDNDFECASVISAHSQDVKKVIWHPIQNILVSCSYDDTIKFYKEIDNDWSSYQTLNLHESIVWSIDFNATGDRLVSCSDDTTIRIWKCDEKDTWSCIATLSGFHSRPIYDVSWSPINNLIATASGDNSICIFREDSTYSEQYELLERQKEAHLCDVNSVHWNNVDSQLLASCSDDGIIKIWKINENSL